MRQIIRLTESDLHHIVRNALYEINNKFAKYQHGKPYNRAWKSLMRDYDDAQNQRYADDALYHSHVDKSQDIDDVVDDNMREYGTDEYNKALLSRLINNRLPYHAGSMMRKFYGIDCEQMTVEEIADEYGCSIENIKSILKRSMERLKYFANPSEEDIRTNNVQAEKLFKNFIQLTPLLSYIYTKFPEENYESFLQCISSHSYNDEALQRIAKKAKSIYQRHLEHWRYDGRDEDSEKEKDFLEKVMQLCK